MADEVMTAVQKAEAVAMAEIHAMRQVADTLKALTDTVSAQGRAQADHTAASTRALEKLSEKVEGMNGRLIRLEEQKHGREIDALSKRFEGLEKRIDLLESTRDQQRGAKLLVDWLRQTAPWLVTVGIAIAAIVGIKEGSA